MKGRVGSPFALKYRPVVRHAHGAKETPMRGMNLLLQGVQFTHPIGRQLLVQQLLGTLPIVDPKKLILTAFILQTDPVHLPSQPLPAVDADLKSRRGTTSVAADTSSRKAEESNNDISENICPVRPGSPSNRRRFLPYRTSNIVARHTGARTPILRSRDAGRRIREPLPLWIPCSNADSGNAPASLASGPRNDAT